MTLNVSNYPNLKLSHSSPNIKQCLKALRKALAASQLTIIRAKSSILKNAWKRTVRACFHRDRIKKMKIWKRIIMMTKKMACQRLKKIRKCSLNRIQKTCFKTKRSHRAITALQISKLIVANKVQSLVHLPRRCKLDHP